MPDFMGSYRDSGQGVPVELFLSQAHHLCLGIVVITLIACFDFDRLQAVFVEQVAGKLGAGPGIAVGGQAVALEYPLHPDAGAENDHQDQHYEDGKNHRVELLSIRSW